MSGLEIQDGKWAPGGTWPRMPECWSIALDREDEAPRTARRALGAWLPDLSPRVRENALVAVTELVTNSVLFGHPPIHVRASVRADVLVVEVSDDGDERPRRRVPSEDGGIGLNIVYLLADRVEIETDRSSVRCEFALRAPRDQ